MSDPVETDFAAPLINRSQFPGVVELQSVAFDGVNMPVRELLAKNIGKALTPELAASIDIASRLDRRLNERVDRLTQELNKMPQVECPVSHHFAPGLYVREINLPKGTVITGAEHKTEHLIIVSKGRLLVATEDGAVEVSAGQIIRCMPGTKNAVTALEDSAWCNVLANPENETDEDRLVSRYTTTTADKLLGGTNNDQALRQIQMET